VRGAVGDAGSPVPIVQFTSGDLSIYDHFNWPTEVDWSAAAC
jgi:hypothetical protein